MSAPGECGAGCDGGACAGVRVSGLSCVLMSVVLTNEESILIPLVAIPPDTRLLSSERHYPGPSALPPVCLTRG